MTPQNPASMQQLMDQPGTILSGLSPGAMAGKTPMERGQALKRKKGVLASAALSKPASPLR